MYGKFSGCHNDWLAGAPLAFSGHRLKGAGLFCPTKNSSTQTVNSALDGEVRY